jgi:hypothetical protein
MVCKNERIKNERIKNERIKNERIVTQAIRMRDGPRRSDFAPVLAAWESVDSTRLQKTMARKCNRRHRGADCIVLVVGVLLRYEL